MSDLLARLKAGRSALRRVTVGNVELGLRVLSEQDYLDAGLAAQAAMDQRKLELTVATADLFEDEKASQLLQRAVVDPDTGNPVAASAQALRDALSRSERSYLVEAYLEHEKQFSPSEAALGEAAFAELLEAVKKTPEKALSNVSSTATLKRLITTLVCPPAN
ncbi:hypothetical protein [Oryzomicrobium sp.]|uniref:hypothetical protein n=1 Tax=Oryzomicrobium sp. TaxID=1911578 RepID=UPI002FE1DD01